MWHDQNRALNPYNLAAQISLQSNDLDIFFLTLTPCSSPFHRLLTTLSKG